MDEYKNKLLEEYETNDSQVIKSLHENDEYKDSDNYSLKNTPKKSRKSDSAARIIVSFTSFPARINIVHRVLKSLYAQSKKPDKIILWLAEEQFLNLENDLPTELVEDRNEGKFDIRWCDDLGSHKKYFYAMQEYPEDIIITIDDDTIYHQDVIKTLYELHRKYPRAVTSIFAKLMLFDDDIHFLPYNDWLYNVVLPVPSMQIIPMGGGGVLYPPHVLDEGVFDKQIILNKLKYKGVICDDDVWLKMHSLLAGNSTVTQPQYTVYNQVINTPESIRELDIIDQQQNNLLASDIMSFRSVDGKRDIKNVILKAREDGDYYDLNSPIVRERTYQFVLERLNIRIQSVYHSADKDTDYIKHEYLHYVLSFFTTAMTYGDTQLSNKYIAKLKEAFLSIPDIEQLSSTSKFVDALIKYDAVLLTQLNIWHRQLKNYYQMLDNWKVFFQSSLENKTSYTYTQSYIGFIRNLYRFSKNINHNVYSDAQISELRRTVKKEWKEISFLFKFRYMIQASANRIKRYLSGVYRD